MAALCATTGNVGSAVEAEHRRCRKSRLKAAASWRLLVGYSTRSIAHGPNDVAESGPRLRSERQHDCRYGSGCTQPPQTGHTRMAVEDRPHDEHVKRAQILDLGGNFADVGAGHDLVAGA